VTVRTLVTLGGICLLAAAALMAFVLPREFSALPEEAFRSKLLSVSPSRDGVTIKARSTDSTEAVIIEWR